MIKPETLLDSLNLLSTAVHSHLRLEAVEREFEQSLEKYWSEVQAQVDHGILLAKLEWEKSAKVHDRANAALERECARLARKCERQTRSLAKFQALISAGRKAKRKRSLR